MDKMYLDNLDEFIFDESKIVTYKWLSLTLKVGANIAKQMLYHYVKERAGTEKPLMINYLVSGVVAGENGFPDMLKVVITREENLETIKTSMNKIASVHIYSVQSTAMKDLSGLYSVDYDKVKESIAEATQYSNIKCTEAKPKSADDLSRLKQQMAYKPPPEAKKIETKGTIKGPGNTIDNKPTPKANIASMFKNQPKKPEKKSPTKENPKSKTNKKEGGMSAFLSKGPPEKKIKKESPVKTESTEKNNNSPKKEMFEESSSISKNKSPKKEPKIKDEPMDFEESSNDSSLRVTKTSKKECKTYSRKKSPPTKKNKKADLEDPMPKRRRIMQVSDSESSDDDDEEEEEGEPESPLPPSPIPPLKKVDSDDEDMIPGTPQPEPKATAINGKSRKLKQVIKTYTDEDGFLNTKKEFEYVSGSDSEDPIPVKKVSPVKQEKKSPPEISEKQEKVSKRKSKASPTKSTQSSIMSFFKKK